MKRTSTLLTILAILVIASVLTCMLASCGIADTVKNILEEAETDKDGESEQTGTDGNATISAANDYKSEEINAKVDALKASGIMIRMRISGSGTDKDESTVEYAYGAKGDIYYYDMGEGETYLDLSADDHYDTYTSHTDDEGNVVWHKETAAYSEYYSKEEVKAGADATSSLIWGYFGIYADAAAGEGTKSTITMLGRSCDKYVYSDAGASIQGAAKYKSEYVIDKETGICMKYVVSIDYATTTGSGSVGMSFECTEFNTHYNPVLPAVTEQGDGDED